MNQLHFLFLLVSIPYTTGPSFSFAFSNNNWKKKTTNFILPPVVAKICGKLLREEEGIIKVIWLIFLLIINPCCTGRAGNVSSGYVFSSGFQEGFF